MAGHKSDATIPRIALITLSRMGMAVTAGCLTTAFMMAAPQAADQAATVSFPAVTGTMYNGNNAHAPNLGPHQRRGAAISPTGTDASPTTGNKGGESGTGSIGGGN